MEIKDTVQNVVYADTVMMMDIDTVSIRPNDIVYVVIVGRLTHVMNVDIVKSACVDVQKRTMS